MYLCIYPMYLLYVCMYECMYVRMYVRMYVCMYVCIYRDIYSMNECMYVCIYLCIYSMYLLYVSTLCMHPLRARERAAGRYILSLRSDPVLALSPSPQTHLEISTKIDSRLGKPSPTPPRGVPASVAAAARRRWLPEPGALRHHHHHHHHQTSIGNGKT